jgi:hypothetical protein
LSLFPAARMLILRAVRNELFGLEAFRVLVFSLKGWDSIAQGNALGDT